ncbi:uracil-DNA glycosylase family protein [Candidatus Bathyarchaeota archaeon]|nr:uracil-DNA glycosylase family protein [Candidatus Bathyarchaeota archaeon]
MICGRPSTGTFPDKAVKLFYGCLEDYGLEDAHITDLIKCSQKLMKAEKRLTKKYADKCFKHLIREIEILKPKTIVAVGRKVHSYLKNNLPPQYRNRLCEHNITHYSYASRYKKEDKLKQDVETVKRTCVKNKKAS